ncbi:hypothetical protein [Burkholderia gladioli]|uniref:hypothetical protein n=1 Tax=Burkholderia gladioli TaxID=28095 RepID=UPI001640970B|nr:hypothetical protein [Burkholderia gladioli]
MLDLLMSCPLLRQHIQEGKVGLGINHEMGDYRNRKKKNLDLVLCRYTTRGSTGSSKSGKKAATSFAELVNSYDILLTTEEKNALAKLPVLPIANVSSVVLAMEAKAAMTAFAKARPRLKDELTSSFQTIHGDSSHAIAAGLVIVNTSKEFISPDINKFDLSNKAPEVSKHIQPKSAQLILDGLRELQRRSSPADTGFDAIGVVLINCRNDGQAPISVSSESSAILPDTDDYHYTRFIERLATLYSLRCVSL